MNRPFFRSAFTLIELLVVVSIIAILALIALPNLQDAQVRSKVAAVKNNMRDVGSKLEMLQVDSNRYPLAAKWRWITLWATPDPNPNPDYQSELFTKTLKSLYGPHEDLFEWAAMKQLGMQDDYWIANKNGSFLFNGFGFFHTPTMLDALDEGCTWQDSDFQHWDAAHNAGGDWILYSCGPDLVVESPSTLSTPGGGSFNGPEEGYTERKLFTDYDPTNGTVSYGNIFRSQKLPSGLAGLQWP